METKLTPNDVVRTIFGGPDNVAAIIGIGTPQIYRWASGGRDRDQGDLTSPRHMRTLLTYSRQHNLGLTADHLIFGADQAEIDAILAARAPATTDTPAVAAE